MKPKESSCPLNGGAMAAHNGTNEENHRCDDMSWGVDSDIDDDDIETSSVPTQIGGDEKQSSQSLTELKEIEDLARTETNSLVAWRIILLCVMVLTGVVASSMTYRFLKHQEHGAALSSYNLFTQTVQSASAQQVHNLWLALDGMAQTVSAAAAASPTPFPFVRVPVYEVPGGHARTLSRVEYVAWSPLVTWDQTSQWSTFVQQQGNDWYEESKGILWREQETHSDVNEHHEHHADVTEYDETHVMRTYIWQGNRSMDGVIESVPVSRHVYAPLFQCSPAPYSPTFLNFDLLSESYLSTMVPSLQRTRSGLVTPFHDDFGNLPDSFAGVGFQNDFHGSSNSKSVSDGAIDHPHSIYVQPVFDWHRESETPPMVGFLTSVVAWDVFLANLLPQGVRGIHAVLQNSCNQSYTYELNGQQSSFLGKGDLHETKYSATEFSFPLVTYSNEHEVANSPDGHCLYSMSLYFSGAYTSDSDMHLEVICTLVVGIIFCSMAAAFCMYDRFVRRRNDKIIGVAVRSNVILASLFPTQVRERLFAEKSAADEPAVHPKSGAAKLKSMMHTGKLNEQGNAEDEDMDDEFMYKSKPIADLFTETTILFADIAGFTAWSSVREPSQVFTLLETLFKAFDSIAKKRGIFKVETVGDCYVAVAGLPDARKDHAVAMARFARDCMVISRTLTKKLQVILGPDTADLAMRMGMHSGPVTAGVLRGERSRFQLFGDTMNTAARMESNGIRDRIQMSQETADLLNVAGKTSWIVQREELINAKGKGEMQTYWLEVPTHSSSRSSGSTVGGSEKADDDALQALAELHDEKTQGLISWNVDVLLRLLKQIVARRSVCEFSASEKMPPAEGRFLSSQGSTSMEEVKEIITLPKFKRAKAFKDPSTVVLDPAVIKQVYDFVSAIALMYHSNPFHNFEHASHVAMSVVKLLSRIVAPADLDVNESSYEGCESELAMDLTLHDHTYGITSDPLTRFACVLSALIHDADHPGVPNAQLVREQTDLATQYSNKSVAEQNSVDLTWSLLMNPDYNELRSVIYATDDELLRFRQIVVNAVMATDIMDQDLKKLRNTRWSNAFTSAQEAPVNDRAMVNRKATIVIEHLLQASDVSHTMQHWHIYRKWNERFFLECHQAFVNGRADKNPIDGWYEGELGFFDFYIIPLAKKLKDCGVFGVSSDEYLNYAVQNRQEWEKRGRDVVNELAQQCEASQGQVALKQAVL